MVQRIQNASQVCKYGNGRATVHVGRLNDIRVSVERQDRGRFRSAKNNPWELVPCEGDFGGERTITVGEIELESGQ